MGNFELTFAIVAAFVCITTFGEIDGSYVIEVDLGDSDISTNQTTSETEQILTINIDDEGVYSAELSGGLVGDQSAETVEVDNKEFSITFVFDVRGGTFQMTYSGEVEDGEMSGTFSSGMGDFDFSGKLKEEDEPNSEDEAEENKTHQDDEADGVETEVEKQTITREGS